MTKILTFLLISALFSCDSPKIEGVYFYTEIPKEKDDDKGSFSGAIEMGREIGCSIIGKFEFRNGKCYFSTMGIEQRADYEIDNGVIYLGSNELTNSGIGIRITDDSTISYSGCIFKKIDFNKIKYTTTNASTDLRSGPGKDYRKLETLKSGTDLYVLDDTKVWVKVRVNWKEGYLHKDYLGAKERQSKSSVLSQSTKKTNKNKDKPKLKDAINVDQVPEEVDILSAWKFDEIKIPSLSDDEGRIIFKIKVSEVGEIIEIETLESSLSRESEDLLIKAFQGQILTKTSNGAPPIFVGKIVYTIRSK